MAISRDGVSSFSGTGTGELSWSVSPIETTKGAVVFISQDGNATDQVTGVTYGGVALSPVAGSPVLHSSPEAGAVYAYFKGSGLPSGNQTVVVSVNGTGSPKCATVITFTADADVEIIDVDVSMNSGSQANPSVTVSPAGRTAHFSLGFFSGIGAIALVTESAGWINRNEVDFGNTTGGCYERNSTSSSDQACGWTQTSDDAAMIAVAVGEAAANVTITPDTAALALTAFAPTVSAPRLVTPSTASLTVATFAPTVSTPIVCTPALTTLTITTFAATIVTPNVVTPGTASLTLTTFAPTPSTPVTVVPDTGALTLSTFAPEVSTPQAFIVTPATASLTLSAHEPIVTVAGIVQPIGGAFVRVDCTGSFLRAASVGQIDRADIEGEIARAQIVGTFDRLEIFGEFERQP